MRLRPLTIVLACGATLLACAPPPRAAGGDAARAAAPAVPPALDHVILGIDSLERGVALLQTATGVAAAYGGAHPGRGTHNALLALGDGRYLELLAPNPADTAAASQGAQVRALRGLRALTPVGWAYRVASAEAAREALRAAGLPAGPVLPGARVRADGRRLAWRTVAPWGPVLGPAHRGVLPFAIAWSPEGVHPATDAPAGCTLERFGVVSPAADTVRALLARAGVPAAVTAGAREHVEFTMRCPRGRVAYP